MDNEFVYKSSTYNAKRRTRKKLKLFGKVQDFVFGKSLGY